MEDVGKKEREGKDKGEDMNVEGGIERVEREKRMEGKEKGKEVGQYKIAF